MYGGKKKNRPALMGKESGEHFCFGSKQKAQRRLSFQDPNVRKTASKAPRSSRGVFQGGKKH